MSDYYKASDVLIISLKDVPLYEIMIPSKFQVYLVTHKPIFAIFKGEVRKIVENYSLGLAANPSDIDDIAKGFKMFSKFSKDEIKKISENSEYLSKSIFNREKLIEKINQFIW